MTLEATNDPTQQWGFFNRHSIELDAYGIHAEREYNECKTYGCFRRAHKHVQRAEILVSLPQQHLSSSGQKTSFALNNYQPLASNQSDMLFTQMLVVLLAPAALAMPGAIFNGEPLVLRETLYCCKSGGTCTIWQYGCPAGSTSANCCTTASGCC